MSDEESAPPPDAPPPDPPVDLQGPGPTRAQRKKAEVAASERTERLPPHDLLAEQATLGCILLKPNECIPDCIEMFKAGAAVFYDIRHQRIYTVMLDLYDNRKSVEVITVFGALKNIGLDEQCGGLAYLAALPDATPSAANLATYTAILRDLHAVRTVITTCTDVVARSYEPQPDVPEFLDTIARDLNAAIDGSSQHHRLLTAKELAHDVIDRIEKMHQNQGSTLGIATGFVDFDKMTGGLMDGDLIILAARPSCGKTALAINMADHVACNLKLPVGVFSLEMTAQSLMMRAVCSRARVNIRNVSDGFLAERDFPKLTASTAKLANAPLHIDDTSSLSITALRAKARRMHSRFGIKLFVIDYLQLMNAGKRVESRQQEVSQISAGVKSLAKELNVPVIGISQLNRDIEKQGNRKPRLSDLRESGSIEQDADLVAMLYRAKVDDDEPDLPEAEQVTLKVAKQRNGPTGEIPLVFLRPYTRFETASKFSE